MERKIGQLYAWNRRGFGLIVVSPRERYFVHVSEIDLDRLPVAGEQVTFETTRPRKLWQLPCAVRVQPVAEVKS
jgi:cold shock CspA family protein